MLHLLMLLLCWAGCFYLLLSQKNHTRRLLKCEPQDVLALRITGGTLLFIAFSLCTLSDDWAFYCIAYFGHFTLASSFWAIRLAIKS